MIICSVRCSDNPVPKGILTADKMEKVAYDLLRVDEYVTTYVAKDTTADIKMKRSIFYEQVFNLNKTSRKEFFTSFKYYQRHPDLQKELFDSLTAAVDKEKIVLQHIKPLQP